MQRYRHLPALTVTVIFIVITVLTATALAKEKGKSAAFDLKKTALFIREMESRPDFPVSVILVADYVYSLQALGEPIAPGKKNAIIGYLKSAQQKDGGFIADKSGRISSLLYTDTAIETLARLNAVNAVDTARAKAFVAAVKNADGGFGFSREARESSLATTFYAVRILKTLNALDLVDQTTSAQYIKGFERNSGGFGYVKGTGIANAKNTFMAAYTLNALGKLDNKARTNAVKFLAKTPYLNKKSKERPELDEQLYAVKALKELKAADRVDGKLAVAFMRKLYIPANGGFGPLEGYGATPDSTTTGLRILNEIGILKRAAPQLAKK
jgi:hypothetical protein